MNQHTNGSAPNQSAPNQSAPNAASLKYATANESTANESSPKSSLAKSSTAKPSTAKSPTADSNPKAIDYVELPTISLAQRLQLWRRADVALFLPIREGLNTYPLEAVFARRTLEPGVVVLSEFASCSRVLNGALRANPWNTLEVKETLELALRMERTERLARRERDLDFISHTTSKAWAERFVMDLQARVSNYPLSRYVPPYSSSLICHRIRFVLQAVSEQASADELWEPIGFGLAGFRRAAWRSDFTALDTTAVLASYRRARRRAIFLDWGASALPSPPLITTRDHFQ